jgi:hypothetical protein
MKTALIIAVFLVFCAVSFFLGYRLGYSEYVEEEILDKYGDEILDEVAKIIEEKKNKENENSDPKI